MAKIEDVDNSTLLFSEQASAPTTPATGKWRLYMKSDGLYVVDDAGTETGPLAEASAGSGGVTLKHAYTETGGDKTTTSSSFAAIDSTASTFTKSVTVAEGSRLRLTFTGTISNTNGGSLTYIAPAIGGTIQGGTNGLVRCESSAAGDNCNASFTYITDTLTAGTYTIALYWRVTGGTGTLYASTTVAAQFTIEELAA